MKVTDFFSKRNNRRITQVINGVWALQAARGFLVVAVFGLYLYFSWLNDVIFNGKEFLWWDFILFTWGLILYSGAAYILIRIGYEELNNKKKTGSHSNHVE